MALNEEREGSSAVLRRCGVWRCGVWGVECGGVGCGCGVWREEPSKQMDKCRENEAVAQGNEAVAQSNGLCGRCESSRQVGSSKRQGRGKWGADD